MSASWANVTTSSVTAEQIYPIITPLTTSMDIHLIRLDINRTKPMESIAPANAAAIIPAEFTILPLPRKKTMTSATTIFAPEEIPSTKGPAMGLWKKVCKR